MRQILVNSVVRMLLCVSVIGILASALFAADPLTGTWRLEPSKTQGSNPPQMTFTSINNGIRIQMSGGKPVDYFFDGKDHPTGNGNAASIVRVNDHTIVTTNKRDEKVTSKSTRAASVDGKHLTVVNEGTGVDGPYKNTSALDRVGPAPTGDAYLGTWQQDPSKNKYEPPSTITFKVDGDKVDISTNVSHVVTAKFDGKDYKLDSSNATWRLKRIDDDTIEVLRNNPNGAPTATQWQVKGNVLISTSTGTGADGKPSRLVQYFERVK